MAEMPYPKNSVTDFYDKAMARQLNFMGRCPKIGTISISPFTVSYVIRFVFMIDRPVGFSLYLVLY